MFGPTAGDVRRVIEPLDQHLAGAPASVGERRNHFLRHVQIQTAFVVALAYVSETIAIAGHTRLGVVLPVLHRADDGEEKAGDETEFTRFLETDEGRQQPGPNVVG